MFLQNTIIVLVLVMFYFVVYWGFMRRADRIKVKGIEYKISEIDKEREKLIRQIDNIQ